LKGFEKRKLIEKFIQNDEVFYKVLNFISPLTAPTKESRRYDSEIISSSERVNNH
jgi:hypothetical protein